VEIIGRVAILLALLGPPLIGIAIPLTSGILLRRSTVPPAVAVGILVLWIALAAGTAIFLIRIAAFTAMGWGHSGTVAPTRQQVELAAISSAGLLLLTGCGIVLHRLLIRAGRVAGTP
jgi:hypothetical protein